MVERALSMGEVEGSMPSFSNRDMTSLQPVVHFGSLQKLLITLTVPGESQLLG